MTPERWKRIEELYHAAHTLPPGDRAAFLAEACPDDAALRGDVESLLNEPVSDDGFFAEPAVAIAGHVVADVAPAAMTGRPLGGYHLQALLGAGGMGEVYRARDSKLGRDVAIKILPRAFTSDADRLARFEREARMLAALNHPNICAIYGLEEADGLRFLILELVEGETLADRLANLSPLQSRGSGLPLRDALGIARQIAEALEVAHERGIIHRDLKPANVNITPDGVVKVLDFGLAKAVGTEGSTPDLHAPVVTHSGIHNGVVMGTAAYMSPEQARGLPVDKRTDIWAFGCVLFEMLTGRVAFVGDTVSDTIAKILEREPDWSALPAATPAAIRRLLLRCLAKAPKQRLRDIGDVRIELDAIDEALPGVSEARVAPLTPARIHRTWLPWVAVVVPVVLLLSLSLIAYWHARNTGVAIESIAVLPFDNQNREPETDYLAEGLAESIINKLARLSRLRVIARSSAFRYKGNETDPLGAGRALGVHAVVTGRVLQRGENLTISAELMDVRENRQLWGQQYNGTRADVFAVQDEMAKEISAKLRLSLTGAERQQLTKRPTENLRAFQYYLQGRPYALRRTREDLFTAIRYYEKAIDEDGNYAIAYAGLADAYGSLGARGYIAPIEGRRKQEEAARKALALDEDLAEAHAALGLAYTLFTPHNFSLGDRELRRAIELSPSLAVAHLYLGGSLARRGRLDESLDEYLKARELDPLSSLIARAVAFPYYLKRDYGRALELLRQANEIYAAQAKRAEALQIIKELEEMSGTGLDQAHWIAKVYAALNERELALGWLERGLAAGAIGIFIKDEPVWDAIRSDPRFADLLRRMGIPS